MKEESREVVSVKGRVMERRLKERRWRKDKVTRLPLDSVMTREKKRERETFSYNRLTYNTW